MDNSFYLEDAEIIKQLFLKSPHLQSNSLYKGKMGIVLFLYEFANLTQNDAFKRFASFLLDLLWEDIEMDSPINLALGLSGIGVGIELLSQRKFIDCNNTSELCFELNNQIMTQNIYRLTDYTFETGLSGIIYYVLIHIKNNRHHSFDKVFLSEIFEKCIQIDQAKLNEISKFYISYYLDYFKGEKNNNLNPQLSHFINKKSVKNFKSMDDMGLYEGIVGYLYLKYFL